MMVRNLYVVIVVIFAFFLFSQSVVLAQSNYVLPYPSHMPGSSFYKIQLLIDNLQKYWYFGNFGQFSYNLGLSDKYMVEAKTLFEYKQYLLGLKVLKKSNEYFTLASHFLQKARLEKKDTSEKQALFKNALQKHKEVLLEIKNNLPEDFIWKEEKENEQYLKLWEEIENSIKIKESCI